MTNDEFLSLPEQEKNDFADQFDTAADGWSGCRFLRLNDRWAVKGYYNPQTCQKCFKMQKHAASHNLGPLTYGEIFEMKFNGSKYHCFITEIVSTILNEHKDYRGIGGWWQSHAWYKDDDNCVDFNAYGLPDLKNELKGIGFIEANDLHLANVGWLPDGTFVVFDFDHCQL